MPVCNFCHFLIYENNLQGIRIVKTHDPIPKWRYYHPQCFREYIDQYNKNPFYKSINSSACC